MKKYDNFVVTGIGLDKLFLATLRINRIPIVFRLILTVDRYDTLIAANVYDSNTSLVVGASTGNGRLPFSPYGPDGSIYVPVPTQVINSVSGVGSPLSPGHFMLVDWNNR